MASDISTAVKFARNMQVYAQKSLQAGAVNTNNINELLTKAGLRAGSFDLRFPTLYSFHGIDVTKTLADAVSKNEITANAAGYAKIAMQRAMVKISNNYPVLTKEKWLSIETALSDFASITIEASQDPNPRLADNAVHNLKEAYNRLRGEAGVFKDAYLVSYISQDSAMGGEPSVKVLANSFSNFRNSINNIIKKEILEVLKENGVTNSKLKDPSFITTKILNWGHTRVGDSIISGKLIATLISLTNINTSNEALEILSKDFIKQTGQIDTEIKLSRGDLTKGDGEVLSLVIESKFLQKVIAQQASYNQSTLGSMEKAWDLEGALQRSPELRKLLGVSNIAELGEKLIKMKSSPNTLDSIGEILADMLKGKKPKSTKDNKTLPGFSQKTTVTSRKVKVKPKPGMGVSKGTVPPIRNTQGKFTSLASLQTLLNLALAQQIQQNMGTGTSKNILNYRTGRLAESAQVTSMSQSREGMITAFYTYQRNPYGTFEPGYAQGSPKTRDPKLLISKSIREIMSTQVNNRMRAVLA